MPEEENFNEEETYVSTKNAFSVYDNSLENFKPKYLEVEQIPEEKNFNIKKKHLDKMLCQYTKILAL